MECGQCNMGFINNKQIDCSGFCSQTFHRDCVNIESKECKIIRKSQNCMWFCDDCKNLLKNQTIRMIIGIHTMCENSAHDIIDRLQHQITFNRQQTSLIYDLLTEVASHVIPSTSSESVMMTQSSPRSSRVSSADSYIPYTRRPVNSPNLIDFGSVRDTRSPSNSENSSIAGAMADTISESGTITDSKFWIHMSRFHPDTYVDDILYLVKKYLGTANCKVVKLFPKNRCILDFVCFKVGLSRELRDKALNLKNWPEGVNVREFGDINYNATGSSAIVQIFTHTEIDANHHDQPINNF